MELNPTTIVFEIVNFVVLALILWRVLYRPLRRAIEARQARIEEDLQAARSAREEAERGRQVWEARERELRALREEVRRDALDGVEAERSRILAQAREDAAAELARVRQLLSAEQEAAAAWVRSEAWARSTELAGRMLLTLAPEQAEQALADRLVEVLDAAVSRGDLDAVQEDDAPRVELTGTRTPSADLVARVRAALERSGSSPRITTSEDPSLVAGWTLRVGDQVVDGSIAGQLEAFRELAQRLDEEGGSRA
ncbi:MAG: F0F1 ATP synthase subunit delta [Sandaracinaceae bacterium]